jgi:polar amino acid transport system substrate-binding protein
VLSETSTAHLGWGQLLLVLQSALVTLIVSVGAMVLAIPLGMGLALGRLYGPKWLGGFTTAYVELLRGTPVLLQLYVLYYGLAGVLRLDPLSAAVLGLGLNYAAYEAEVYRAGILAVPRGQMEAALALGMTPFTAIRTVIVPQAVRVVIPPVTNDFIALFKDTSVCSVILITELTRKYNELYNFNRDFVVQLAFLTAGLYLLMSYPLSVLARVLEHRMGSAGGAHR